jgi:hypothetical protein
MSFFILLINLNFYQPILTQRFLDMEDEKIKKYKPCKTEKCLNLLPFIQFERPEAISANQ